MPVLLSSFLDLLPDAEGILQCGFGTDNKPTRTYIHLTNMRFRPLRAVDWVPPLSVIVISLVQVTCSPAASAAKRVLILDPFGRDIAPFSYVASAFRTTLASELGQPVDFTEASLDWARYTGSDFDAPFLTFLQQRLQSQPADLIVPIGIPAGKFVSEHLSPLFPRTPVLYTALDTRGMPPDFLSTNSTMVTYSVNIRSMLDEILQLQPDTTNVVVVFGSTPLEQFWAQTVLQESRPLTNRITVTALTNQPLSQVCRQIAVLPPRSAIFFGLVIQDSDLVPYDHNDALKLVRSSAGAPVFGIFRSQLGDGILGGRLYPDASTGETAARAAVRILRGESPGSIPAVFVEAPPPVYDARELKRWKINTQRLPAGSTLLFREPGLVERYGVQIALGLAVLGLQTVLIVRLLVLRVRRRAQEQAANLLADLSSRFIHLSPGELDSEIQQAQSRVCKHFGLDISALWQWRLQEPGKVTLTHLCRPGGGPPVPEGMNAADHFPWCLRMLQEGQIVCVDSLAKLPPEAAQDREMWEHFGIKSNLTFPLSVGGSAVFGALGFNTTREVAWSPELTKHLQMVALFFASALERRRAQLVLEESETRLNLAADSAGAALWSLNLDSGEYWLTERSRQMFGLAPGSRLTVQAFLEMVHPRDREAIRRKMDEVVHSRAPGTIEYRLLNSGDDLRWMISRGRFQPGHAGHPDCLTGITIDITERKQTEDALRSFGARLISAQEQERARLARELHDDITQRLARLAIDVAEWRMFPESVARENQGHIRRELVRLSEDVHALSYRLHPSIIEDLGLDAALHAEVEHSLSRDKVTIKIEPLPESIPPEVALGLFRVAQEAMRNATRYADARRMKLSLRAVNGGLELAFQDDGRGFNSALQDHHTSLGLLSMQERVRSLGGELEIESAAGQGTTILAWVPLSRNNQ